MNKNRTLVWLNVTTGEFSESWNEADYPTIDTDLIIKKYSPMDGWKLIEYKCLNDEDFQFNKLMVIK